MIIRVDKEGQKAVLELADVTLKTVGLQAFPKIQQLLSSLSLIEDEDKLKVEKSVD